MPLIKSPTKSARDENIEEMIDSGRDPKQAVAAAYSNQRRSARHDKARHTKRRNRKRS